jgi:TonB family protein
MNPAGRVYDAVVKTPSGSTDLDQSCLDALNQVEQMGPTPSDGMRAIGPAAAINFVTFVR